MPSPRTAAFAGASLLLPSLTELLKLPKLRMFPFNPYPLGKVPIPTTGVCDFKLEPGQPIDDRGFNPCAYKEWLPPPEMPESVRAESQKGHACYYGFEYPDAAVVAYDAAHGIARPDSSMSDPYYVMNRKRIILREKTRELGLALTGRLVEAPVEPRLDVPGARLDDTIHFAWLIKGKFAASFCPTVEKIKSLMQVLGVPGEPRWLVN